jgi:site-specific recombinase XerD
MTSNPMELKILIQGFKLSCQTEGKSLKTIEWYMSFLKRFNHFLENNDYSASIDRIEKDSIRAFILYLQQEAKTPHTFKPLSYCTVQGYVRTLKAFFSWLLREEYIESNPMLKIPVPKAPIKIVTTFSDDQVSRLIDTCNRSNGQGYRNLAILMLLLDSGIRVSELIGINLDDVNLSEGSILIRRSKGNKERIVPIGSLVQKILWKYINNYRPIPMTDRITGLFLSERGFPLTKSGIQQMLRRYGRQSGISGMRCSPHVFRHTFAKNYLLNGGDIFSLQKILGHSSLASVRVYLNLLASDIKKQHQRFSPVDTFIENKTLYRSMRSTV